MTEISHSLIKALRGVPGFDVLGDRDLVKVVGASANLHWPSKSVVFEAGSEADALYLVLEGRVRIYEIHDGNEVDVAEVGPGDFFGELSLLLDTTRTRNVQAVEDSELLVVPKDSFHRLLDQQPELAAHFRRKVEDRMAANRATSTDSATE